MVLRQFQCRIMHNILSVREKLYKWKITDTKVCSYCNEEEESVIHLFSECHAAKVLYRKIRQWAKEVGINMPVLSPLLIYTGCDKDCVNKSPVLYG